MATLSAAQILGYAQAAGSGGDPATATAIALAESGGSTDAVGVNSDQWSSRDRGLWQINDHWHAEVSDACAFDAACNAQAAYAISNGWTNFGPWATYHNGAYLQFMQQVATVPQEPPPARSLYGQSVVGQMVSSPWFAGSWEVTQGWGPTDFGAEPEGHGYQHWHAGIDVGIDCGTTIVLPAGLSGTARALDNPGGYGTALVLLLDQGPGIVLGHLRQRLVDDSAPISGGTQLGVSNSTGNSTGCHLHFEARPQDPQQPLGIARYGNDLDPSQWLIAGSGGATQADLLAFNPTQGLQDAAQKAMQTVIAGGEVLLGAAVVIVGLVAAAYGMRGQGAQALQRDTGRQIRRLRQPRPTRPVPSPPRSSQAAESRIRPDLQREVETRESPRESGLRKLREGRQRSMTTAEAMAIGATRRR